MPQFKKGDKVRIRTNGRIYNATVTEERGHHMHVRPVLGTADLDVKVEDIIMGWAEPEDKSPLVEKERRALEADPTRRRRDEILAKLFGGATPKYQPTIEFHKSPPEWSSSGYTFYAMTTHRADPVFHTADGAGLVVVYCSDGHIPYGKPFLGLREWGLARCPDFQRNQILQQPLAQVEVPDIVMEVLRGTPPKAGVHF